MPLDLAYAVVIAGLAAAGLVRYATYRRALDRLEHRLRVRRQAAAQTIVYIPLDDAERPELARVTEQLVGAGLTVLGDARSERDGAVASRWFADGDGTTFGLAATEKKITFVAMYSFTADRAFSTRMPAIPVLATMPAMKRQHVPGGTGLALMLARHRELVADAPGLVRVGSLSDALREVARVHDRVVAWRQAQPPHELLDADLQSMLGKHHARLAPVMKRRLELIPAAKLL